MTSFKKILEAIGDERKDKKALFGGLEWRVESLGVLGEQIIEEAKRAQVTSLPSISFDGYRSYVEQGDRKTFENQYFERRRRLCALALQVFLDDTQDVSYMENELWQVCNEFTWALPAHIPTTDCIFSNERNAPWETVDLFAAETAHMLAEIYVLMGARLHPLVIQRIEDEINRRILQPLFYNPAPFTWESAAHNWSAVCAGAIGMTVLLMVEDKNKVAGMLARLLGALESFMEGFSNDGGCAEGVGYWGYGFGYYIYFADMLYHYTEGKLDLLSASKVKEIACFPYRAQLSRNHFVSYSDGQAAQTLPTGLLSRLRNVLGVEVPSPGEITGYHFDHCYRWAHMLRNVIWTEDDVLNKEQEDTREHFYLPNTGWVIHREQRGADEFAFSIKGGHNNEPHNHNDLGNFILHVNGEDILVDLGAGLYTKDYFGEKRYEILNNRSKGHSVPVIGGQEQQSGAQYECKILSQSINENEISYTLDVTRAYGLANLKQFYRSFTWKTEESKCVLNMHDYFRYVDRPETIQEAFISYLKPEITDHYIVWKSQHAEVKLQWNKECFTPSLEVHEILDHYEQKQTVYRLVLQSEVVNKEIEGSFSFYCFPANK
ncbi:heparinase II/III-family protein [Ectobacillus funiculus]|uniref:heparinase II/III domain-containing protein n=1 Tax=Ectobacillus funiculus TaxID=137993 RepID=UPI003979526C